MLPEYVCEVNAINWFLLQTLLLITKLDTVGKLKEETSVGDLLIIAIAALISSIAPPTPALVNLQLVTERFYNILLAELSSKFMKLNLLLEVIVGACKKLTVLIVISDNLAVTKA